MSLIVKKSSNAEHWNTGPQGMRNLFYYGTKTDAETVPVPPDYFIFLHPVQGILIIMGYYFCLMAWLWPQGVSARFYGELSSLAQHLHTHYPEHLGVACAALAGLNLSCACAALALCWRLRLRLRTTACWVAQTALFGMASLHYLISPQSALINIFGAK